MKKKILFAIFIVISGVVLRIFLNKVVGIPNFEAVTALSLVSGSFLGGFFAPFIPLLIIFLSDVYLGFGHHLVYLFSWSAFILIGIFGILFKPPHQNFGSGGKRNSKHYFWKITGGGIVSVLFFYLWTNFGWWLTFGMYPMNFEGLVACYIAALPFLRNQLASVLIFTFSFAMTFSLIFDKVLARAIKKHEAPLEVFGRKNF